MRRAAEHRSLLAFAVALAAALAWRASPLPLLVVVPFLLFRRTVLWAILGVAIGFLRAPSAVTFPDRTFVDAPVWVATIPTRSETGYRARVVWSEAVWQADFPARVQFGETIHVVGVAEGGLAVPLHRRLSGVAGRLRVARASRLRAAPWPLVAAQVYRQSFCEFVERWSPGNAAALIESLSLSVTDRLDDATETAMKRTGTWHLVSVSGLHVFIVAAAVAGALSRVPIPRAYQLALMALGLGFYGLASGLDPPVVRSVLTAIVGSTAYLWRRERDGLTALAFAASFQLLLAPREVFNVGFQLSFVTVAGLLLFGPTERDPATSAFEFLRALAADSIRVSFVAFVASAPLIAHYFGQVALGSVLANLLVGFVVPAIILGALLAHAVSALALPIGVGLLIPVAAWASYLERSISFLAGFSWVSLEVPNPPGGWVLAFYATTLLLWRERYVPA